MKAYRVHRTRLGAGTPIPPSEDFFSSQDDSKIAVEVLLEKARPSDKPARRDSSFLFESKENSLDLIARRGNGYLFEVDVDTSCPFLRTDWNWPGLIERGKGDQAKMEGLAAKYWAGEMTDHPVVEILAAHATVESEIAVDPDDIRKRKMSLVT